MQVPGKPVKEAHSISELKPAKDVQLKPTADFKTLKKLQQKAQELLNIDQTTTSDSSTLSEDKIEMEKAKIESENEDNVKKKKKYEKVIIKPKTSTLMNSDKVDSVKNNNSEKKQSTVKSKSASISKRENGYVYVPGR